jgi:predicted GIY-YIG superfamily endonuclease
MSTHSCYGLKLENGCFYVGIAKTHNLKLRILQHFTADDFSSKWCKMHKPVEVIYKAHFPSTVLAHRDEKRKTVELMRQYGIRKVRGADALCTRDWCYQKDRLFWVPGELRALALAGELGKLDPPSV